MIYVSVIWDNYVGLELLAAKGYPVLNSAVL